MATIGFAFARTQFGATALSRSEEPAQLLSIEPCVPEDAAERAALQLPVQRHDEERRAVRVLQANMASARPHHIPTEFSSTRTSCAPETTGRRSLTRG